MSEITLDELKERLAGLDEVTLMEILDIHSDELVEAFEDKIEEEQDKLKRMLNDF
jgi:predicted MPP superfamily phosphohydrolase